MCTTDVHATSSRESVAIAAGRLDDFFVLQAGIPIKGFLVATSQSYPHYSNNRDDVIDAFVARLDRTGESGREYTPGQVTKTLRNACRALLDDSTACEALAAAGVDVKVVRVLHDTKNLGNQAAEYETFLDAVAPVALAARDLIRASRDMCRTWRKEGALKAPESEMSKVVGRTESPAMTVLVGMVADRRKLPGSRAELTTAWRRAGVLKPLAESVARTLNGASPKLPRIVDRVEPADGRSVEEASLMIAKSYDAMIRTAIQILRNPADAEDVVGDVIAQGLRSRFRDKTLELTPAYLCGAVRRRANDCLADRSRAGRMPQRNAARESFDDPHDDPFESTTEDLFGGAVGELEQVETDSVLNLTLELLVKLAEEAEAEAERARRDTAKWTWVVSFFEAFEKSPHKWFDHHTELRKHAAAWARDESTRTGERVPRGFLPAFERVCEWSAEVILGGDWK